MMISLINQQFGAVSAKNHHAKKIIVNAILGERNVHHFVNVKIVWIKREYPLKRK